MTSQLPASVWLSSPRYQTALWSLVPATHLDKLDRIESSQKQMLNQAG
jgi:hypothetical protein